MSHTNIQRESGSTEVPSPNSVRTLRGETGRPVFRLSNPKNYVGIPIAVQAEGNTGAIVMGQLTQMARPAKLGARKLGLLEDDSALSERGSQIVAAAVAIHGSEKAALDAFEDLKGSPARFVTGIPDWREPIQAVFVAVPEIVNLLEPIASASRPLTLPQLALRTAQSAPETARSILLDADSISVSDPVTALADHENPQQPPEWLKSTESYCSSTTYQLKSLLYNAGILDAPGASTDRLEPDTSRWAISELIAPEIADHIETQGGGC